MFIGSSVCVTAVVLVNLISFFFSNIQLCFNWSLIWIHCMIPTPLFGLVFFQSCVDSAACSLSFSHILFKCVCLYVYTATPLHPSYLSWLDCCELVWADPRRRTTERAAASLWFHSTNRQQKTELECQRTAYLHTLKCQGLGAFTHQQVLKCKSLKMWGNVWFQWSWYKLL